MTQPIAILGASGYAGREVLRLVSGHPRMRAKLVMTARPGVEPQPPGASFEPTIQRLELDRLGEVDGVFLCTPHGAAAELAAAALAAGCKVVDLSADFRLKDPGLHAATYGPGTAIAEELRPQAVYGLTEHARDQVKAAQLVANPGCYPTAVSLPLIPLLREGLVDLEAEVIADCKSGASGAGKTPGPRNVFGAVHDNFGAYAIGEHRHAPEIWQSCDSDRILFVPHLLPVFRGILATIWLRPIAGVDRARVLDCLQSTYQGEPFVRVYDRGTPDLSGVQLSNRCDIGVAACGERLVLISAIDNLIKGAAGQAVQNMNLMLGLPETEGLS